MPQVTYIVIVKSMSKGSPSGVLGFLKQTDLCDGPVQTACPGLDCHLSNKSSFILNRLDNSPHDPGVAGC